MRYEDLLSRIEHGAGTGSRDAERAVRATLATLSERIGAEESSDLAAQLPGELADAFEPAPRADEMDAGEFVRRVAERIATDEPTARQRIRAVFAALREAVSGGEIEDIELNLPVSYVDLGARRADTGLGPHADEPGMPGTPTLTDGAFVERVRERAGLDADGAEQAIAVVLEAFGERITGGQAGDLAAQLPERAAARLRGTPDAEPLSAVEFAERVARREDVPELIAREHARAVLTTLRESVSPQEWRDTLDELPRDFADMLAAGPGTAV